MQNLQDVYDRVSANKEKIKEIRAQYADALASTSEYQAVKDKLNDLRVRKKQIEAQARSSLAKEFDELEKLKRHVSDDQQMLADMAMAKLMKGESVEITDEYQNRYEPIFTVRFRKAGS